jgi:hypothetical protein
MADRIQSPEGFAVLWCMHPDCSGGENADDPCCGILAGRISKRDAAIRSETRAELIAELRRMADDDVDAWVRVALSDAVVWLEAMARGE